MSAQNGKATTTAPLTNFPYVHEVPPTGETHVKVTNDEHNHEETEINGDQVTYDGTSEDSRRTAGTWPVEADEHVRQLIVNAENQRQAIEDKRADHRNLNRMLTLLGALVIGLAVTFVLNNGYLGAWGASLAPYAFVITILMDSSLAAYSFIRHY